LQGGRNLAEDGFVKDRFLGRYTPGPEKTALDKTFYTHYPNIHTVVSGLLQRAGISIDNRVPFKLLGVSLSLLGLVFLYLMLRSLFTDSIAFLTCFITGISPAFLLYVDSFTSPPYDFLFRNGFLLCFLSYELSSKRRNFLFALAVIFALLQSLNSFDYIPFIQLFTWGFYLLNRSKFSWTKVALIAGAPLLGCAVHFFQVAWFFGSMRDALADFRAIFLARSIIDYGSAPDSRALDVGVYLTVIAQQLSDKYGVGVLGILSLLLCVFLIEKKFRFSRQDALSLSRFGALNILGVLGWWVPFIGATSNLQDYTIPYMSLTFFSPLLAAGILTGSRALHRWRDVRSYIEEVLQRRPGKKEVKMRLALRRLFTGNTTVAQSGAGSRPKSLALPLLLLVCFLSAFSLAQGIAFLETSKQYIRKFPNLGDIGLFSGLPEPYEDQISLAKAVREFTHYGDIILSDSNGAPLLNILSKGERSPLSVGNPLYHYYSQREWNYFDVDRSTPETLLREMCRLTSKRRSSATEGADFKFFLLIKSNIKNTRLLNFLDLFFESSWAGPETLLYRLDEPLLPSMFKAGRERLALVVFPSRSIFEMVKEGPRIEWNSLRSIGRFDIYPHLIVEEMSRFSESIEKNVLRQIITLIEPKEAVTGKTRFLHAYMPENDRLIISRTEYAGIQTIDSRDLTYREILFGLSDKTGLVDKAEKCGDDNYAVRKIGGLILVTHEGSIPALSFVLDPKINEYPNKVLLAKMSSNGATDNGKPLLSTIVVGESSDPNKNERISVSFVDTRETRTYSFPIWPTEHRIERLVFYPANGKGVTSISGIEILGYVRRPRPSWPVNSRPDLSFASRFSHSSNTLLCLQRKTANNIAGDASLHHLDNAILECSLKTYEARLPNFKSSQPDYIVVRLPRVSSARTSPSDRQDKIGILLQVDGCTSLNCQKSDVLALTGFPFITDYVLSSAITFADCDGSGTSARIKVGFLNPGLKCESVSLRGWPKEMGP
jgi:hypothetical protein